MKFSRLLDKDFWALLVSIISSLILFFNSKTDSVITVQADVADAINFLTYPQTWYQDIFLTKEENKKLHDLLVVSNLHLSKYKKYKDENDELRKMLETASFISGVFNATVIMSELKESQPITLVSARVTNRNSASIETIIINVGKDHVTPIKENLAVLDISGGLLGKTIAVGNNASKVQLITDNNFSVSVRVGSGTKSDQGNFIPTVGKYGILEGILKSTSLLPGDLAYTSGISDIYPADIPVAKVISANKDNNKPFQDVKVEIISDFNNLNYIFVIQ